MYVNQPWIIINFLDHGPVFTPSNAGMLFIISSQIVFACMSAWVGVGVKPLGPALEVGYFPSLNDSQYNRAYCSEDGTSFPRIAPPRWCMAKIEP
jgi:hypothetical protein